MMRYPEKNQKGKPGQDSLESQLKKARSLAYRYLTGQSRSRKEVQNKIDKAGFSREVIHQTLALLDRDNLLDDTRFAKDLGESLILRKSCGAKYIEYKLLERGVDRAVVREVVERLFPTEEEEFEVALTAARKKTRTLQGKSVSERKRKLQAHLSRKGFSSWVIYQVCNSEVSD